MSIKRTTNCSAVKGKPGEAVMADGMATQKQPGDFVSLQRKHIFADSTLQNLQFKKRPHLFKSL